MEFIGFGLAFIFACLSFVHSRNATNALNGWKEAAALCDRGIVTSQELIAINQWLMKVIDDYREMLSRHGSC